MQRPREQYPACSTVDRDGALSADLYVPVLSSEIVSYCGRKKLLPEGFGAGTCRV